MRLGCRALVIHSRVPGQEATASLAPGAQKQWQNQYPAQQQQRDRQAQEQQIGLKSSSRITALHSGKAATARHRSSRLGSKATADQYPEQQQSCDSQAQAQQIGLKSNSRTNTLCSSNTVTARHKSGRAIKISQTPSLVAFAQYTKVCCAMLKSADVCTSFCCTYLCDCLERSAQRF